MSHSTDTTTPKIIFKVTLNVIKTPQLVGHFKNVKSSRYTETSILKKIEPYILLARLQQAGLRGTSTSFSAHSYKFLMFVIPAFSAFKKEKKCF